MTVGGIAIGLFLSACGPKPAENLVVESTTPSAGASAAAAPTALSTPSQTAMPTEAAPQVPARPVVPAAPVQPALKSFTFPDGHISFSYPASWSVRIERGPGQEGPPEQPYEVTVSDQTGAALVRVLSGAKGIGCTGGPVHRTVLDRAAVPGMSEVDGTAPTFGFIVEKIGTDNSYVMAVMNPRNLEEGNVSSHCTLLMMGNGGAMNTAIFNQSVYPGPMPAFPSRQAAEAWMVTEQYAQLKALMISLKYS
jgi:hypothetical protein